MTRTEDPARIIGATVTYRCDATEHAYLRGYKLRVIAVMRNGDLLRDDADVGQLRAGDRLDAAPWIAERGRFSFVTSDPRVEDVIGGPAFQVASRA